ncbi:MAG: hypothetical protein JRH01_24690 [Deltaproteobacteria bacterium]|nr:hypothetical protein [Deltaproteobacteria bacterium]
MEGGSWFWTAYYNPLNFVPCALAVAALPGDLEQRSVRFQAGLGLGLLLVAAIAAIVEWHVYVSPKFFEANGHGFPPYTRPSVVLAALGLVVGSLVVKGQAPAWLRFMSRHSLAIYCLHPMLFLILFAHFSSYFVVGRQLQWYACVPVIIGGYLLSLLLQRAVFRRGILS